MGYDAFGDVSACEHGIKELLGTNINIKERNRMDFKEIDKKYRPVPFWSWNEKLDADETRRQVKLMDEAGIGGYFMHARGGLQTEYMGKEWFDNVDAAADEGKKRGMHAWAYDENGWPSGFGNGIVNGKGIKYQQKYLRFEEGEKQTERTICNCGGYHFYYDVNPFYVDVLDGEVIKVFIDEIYQPYYDRYKNDIDGFFTDEPQISRDGIPWSFILCDEYRTAYGEELADSLIELFKPVGNYEKTRFQFWKLITDLFSKNFMKQIYDWCEEHALKFTGHLVLEESFEDQLTTNGAAMPHYEYLHIPGMDWLGRPIFRCLTPLQVGSAAHQLGKKQILSETFALCGHNVGHDELKGIYEWQMVRGINLLCQHLEGYSLRGIRKRDYPPALFCQQPWWSDYKLFNDAMSRIGMILAEGKVEYDTLLIHPQSTAWICFDNGKNEGLEQCNQAFLDVMDELDGKHILYHLGDETIMERHAHVDGAALVIGEQRYTTVVMPEHKILFDSTKKLLEEFKANGGTVTTADALAKNTILDNPRITYTKRGFDGYDVYYFVNSSADTHTAKIAVGSKAMDITTGELAPFYGTYTFAPWDSLVIIDDGSPRGEQSAEKPLQALDISGAWQVKASTPNSITLDYCDYYFDGELIEKNGYVLNIQGRACDLKRPVEIRCEYTLNAEHIPSDVYLVCETPEIFDISINGAPLAKDISGYFTDTSFKKLDISKHLTVGVNKISMTTTFKQSESVYENLEKSKIFESEKNKLTYDVELEAIYITGDFGVKTDGKFTALDRNAVRYNGGFTITKPAAEITLENIEQQGFPFFSGSITLEKTFTLPSAGYKLALAKKGINVIKARVNGGETAAMMWEPLTLDMSGMLKTGENTIELTLTNNLRNLLGPHHLTEGECYGVGPAQFFKEPCIWTTGLAAAGKWDDNYCFAEVSLKQ